MVRANLGRLRPRARPLFQGDLRQLRGADGKTPGIAPEITKAARVAAACGALNAQAFGPMEGDIRPETVEAMLEQA